MGFDIHGMNPAINKTIDEFPILKKWHTVPYNERDNNEEFKKDAEQYWEEHDAEKNANCGTYFRNNVWWWRPLWEYCRVVAEDLFTYEEWEGGHYNDGNQYSEDDCLALASILQEEIDSGRCQEYEDTYCKKQNSLGDKDFNKNYPFSVENVQNFVRFLEDCGGMEIY